MRTDGGQAFLFNPKYLLKAVGRPAADLLQSLHEGGGAKRLSRNEGIDYPFYSFGVSFARHADMLQILHEGDGVITFTLQ